MGLYCSLSAITKETAGKILIYPPFLWKVVAPDDAEVYEEAVGQHKLGFIMKFWGLLGIRREQVFNYEQTGNEGIWLSLDKDWQGIHFLLTGSGTGGKWPCNFLMCGGQTVAGTEDQYRVFTPGQVKQIAAALTNISKEEFIKRFDPAAMMKEDIYPNVWDRLEEEELNRTSLCNNYYELKNFLRRLANEKMGMIVHIG